MKEQILKLREEGKSYKQIKKEVGCSLATISFHCGIGQKEKNAKRLKNRRASNVFISKLERFKNRTISEKGRSFQRRQKGNLIPREEYNFTLDDLVNKIGDHAICYLSGKIIDLSEPKSFHFDHIIPASRGGSNQIENLGLIDSTINKMKHDLTPEEFIEKCKEVLEYNGYIIRKRDE